MSNTPFDDDDEFGFDDLDFDDNELESGDNEGFDFGDDEFDLSPEDEFNFGDEDFDLGGDDEFDLPTGEESRGPSRTFIYIAGAMIGLFVIALVALVLIALSGQGPSEVELTTTAIVMLNATTEAQLRMTQTQAVFVAQTQTQSAALTATQLAQPTATDTPTPTFTPTSDATLAAAMALTQNSITMTAQALENTSLTLTAEAQVPTGPPTIAVDAVALTATALANLLQPTLVGQGGGAVATPTIEGGVAALPTALPQTGLFDDLATGGTGSLTGLFLAMAGLIGVIIISRRVRAVNQ